MANRIFSQALGVAFLLSVAPCVSAHIQLQEPPPRVPDDDALKVSPCGNSTWGQNGTSTFAPGQTINVRFTETIVHPGVFRIAVGMTGDSDLTLMVSEAVFSDYKSYFQGQLPMASLPREVTEPRTEGSLVILKDHFGLHDQECPSNEYDGGACVWNVQVKLPNQTCDKCTLQVIQLMAESGRTYNGGFYYHCADIQIAGMPADNTGGAAGSTGGSAAGGAPSTGGEPASGGMANNTGGALPTPAGGSGGLPMMASGGVSTGTGGAPSGPAPMMGGSSMNGAPGEPSSEDSSCAMNVQAGSVGVPWLLGVITVLLARRRRAG